MLPALLAFIRTFAVWGRVEALERFRSGECHPGYARKHAGPHQCRELIFENQDGLETRRVAALQ